jgi:hypothetical protein
MGKSFMGKSLKASNLSVSLMASLGQYVAEKLSFFADWPFIFAVHLGASHKRKP